MCIIAVKKPGIDLPKADWLKNCAANNRDGIGIMYHKPNTQEVIIKKDFADVQALQAYLTANINKEDALVVHFRLATHGKKDIGNRHPFPLTTERSLLRQANVLCSYALVHNGILTQFLRHEKFSDTQKFVLNIMGDEHIKQNLGTKAIDTLLTNFLGTDKLAIMRYDGTIFLYGEFTEDEGILFSNSGYKFVYSYITKTDKSWQKNWENWKKADNYAFKDKCEACNKEKFVKSCEIERDGYISTLFLCKQCRKNIKKPTKKGNVLEQCKSCFEYKPAKELSQTVYGKICRSCKTENQIFFNEAG